MKFICLGYIDESKLADVRPEQAMRMMHECFAYDDELRRGGHFVSGEALGSVRNAVTLRMEDGKIKATNGPVAETKETLGGILLLEARDLNHAVELMSKHPGVKMGPFEIRESNEAVHLLMAEFSKSRSMNSESVLRTERVIAAPRSAIFAAIANPERLAKWWGPKGFTNTFEQFEFKPGGHWKFVMHGPKGTNYPNESVFREVVPDTKVVIEHIVTPWYKLTLLLTDHSEGTRLEWAQEFENRETADRLRSLCVTANEQNIDRLLSVLQDRVVE